jgi:hypothetical protein
MRDATGNADDRGVAGRLCRGIIQAIVGFLNNAGEPGTPAGAAPFTPVGEDQIDTLEMQARLEAEALENRAKFRNARRFGETRQRENLLIFRIPQLAEIVEVEVLQRTVGHGGVPLNRVEPLGSTQLPCPGGRDLRYQLKYSSARCPGHRPRLRAPPMNGLFARSVFRPSRPALST